MFLPVTHSLIICLELGDVAISPSVILVVISNLTSLSSLTDSEHIILLRAAVTTILVKKCQFPAFSALNISQTVYKTVAQLDD
jgi:hypothetical protein